MDRGDAVSWTGSVVWGELTSWNVVSWWVPVTIGILSLTSAALVLSIRPLRRRRVLLAGGLVLSVALGLLAVGAAVNVHFAYFRTIDQALGGVPGSATDAQIQAQLRRGTMPDAGMVATQRIEGTASGFSARDARVYLPPAWFADPRPALPVLMLFHGDPGQPTDWLQGGEIGSTADAYAARHGGQAPIIVMPDINGSLTADTECLDGAAGNAETYLTQDVPAAVLQRWSPATGPQHWAIGGLSEGGYCAFMLGVRYPDRWLTFVDLSGYNEPQPDGGTALEYLGGSQSELDAHEPLTVLAQPNPVWATMGGWFAVGTDDARQFVDGVEKGAAAAKAAGMTVELRTGPGDHSFAFWASAMEQAFGWVAQRLGLP